VTVKRVGLPLGLALVSAIGCGALARAQDGPPAATPRLVTAPAPASASAPPQSYDRKGRRDPFQPLETGPRTDLTVASAKLKGIIRGKAPRALVETPDGIGYILTPGDVLGEGRLVEIGANSVVFVVPPRRGSTPDRIVLRLPGD
jgi:hypothetical protein